MTPLTDFIENSLYPALFARLDYIFPEWHFRQTRGGNWQTHLRPDKTSSEPRREDRCIVTKKYPRHIFGQVEHAPVVELLSYWMEQNHYGNGQTFDAVEALSKALGITPPERQTSEEWEQFKAQMERREQLYKKMAKALYSEEGAAVLNYLRTTRGYSDELIKKMGIVCVTKEVADAMEDAPRDIEAKWPMAIPYWSGARLYGFKFRAIDPDTKPKYKNTFRLPKEAKLFGLTGINLSGNRDKDRTITIVEGELDALHAQAAGMENICAAAGGTISLEQMAEAKRRGVKRVILLFDTEASEDGQKATNKKIVAALRLIHQAGLKGYVATLPSSEGVKMDVDSYLNTHTKEELEAVVERMIPSSLFLYGEAEAEALEKYNKQQGEVWSQTNIDDFKDEVIALANSPITDLNDRPTIFQRAAAFSNGLVTEESLRARADALKALADKQRQEAEIKAAMTQAKELADAGRPVEALEAIEEKIPTLRKISREAEFGRYLDIPTFRQFADDGAGIQTDYYFWDRKGEECERLLLPSSALSIIAAPTSHGKSTMLRNLALQTAQNGDEGVVLFFTLEETLDNLKVQFASLYASQNLPYHFSGNHTRTLSAYLKKNSTDYFQRGTNVEEVSHQINRFVSEVWDRGLLRVNFIEKAESSSLIELISFYCSQIKVKAVFVDYIQKLHKAGCKNSRRDELGEISGDFETLANKQGLPIIMGAQVNRQAYSPLEIANQNIGESSNIEWGASVIVMLWNSDFKALPESKMWENDPEKKRSPEQTLHESRGLKLGEKGKMFALLTKNRTGRVGLSSVWDYDAPKGIISNVNHGTSQSQTQSQPQPQAPTAPPQNPTGAATLSDSSELPF